MMKLYPAAFSRLALIAAPLAAPQAILAQAAPAAGQANVPHSEPSRGEVEPPPQPSEAARSARVDARGAIAEAPCPLTASSIRVNLTKVQYASAHGAVLPAEIATLLPALAADDAGDKPISVVCAMRDRANAALLGAGYIASVQIPPQDITGGILNLTVVVGRITEVRIHGELGNFKDILEPRIAAIKALYPLNQKDVERLLLLIDDVPGLNVQLALKPAGGAPGDVIGDLTVETRTATVLLNVQNAGSHQLGREVISVRGEFDGLTGHGDRTYLTYSNSVQFHEEHILQVGHDMAVGHHGIRFGARMSYALSNPDIPNLDLRSRSIIAGLDLSAPLVRSVDTNVAATGGFELLNQKTQIYSTAAVVPFTRDRLRVFYGRLEASTLGRRFDGSEQWHLNGTVEIRQGTNLFNATKLRGFEDGYQPSRLAGDPQATVLRGTLESSFHLTPALSLNTVASGQWSNHALLNIEQFSLGNLTYGRGYDPGSNSGDRAFALRAEPRVRLPDYQGFRLELMGFYDLVKIFNLDPSSIENNRTFRSVGGGFRLIKTGLFALDVTYAKPLDRALSTDLARPTDRLLVSLTTQLIPWRLR
jgi:hemolysin activation/secretion protein